MQDIYMTLNNNIETLNEVEKQISCMELELYQKTVNELKEQKIRDLKEYLIQYSKIYNINVEKCQPLIDETIEMYEDEIEKLIYIYNDLFAQVFRIMQNARNNQKIAIANIVKSVNLLHDSRIAIACAQKKINYSVIIDECKARMQWCIEQAEDDIKVIFRIQKERQLELYNPNIFIRFRRFLLNKINGKSRYMDFLNRYQNNDLKSMKSIVRLKTRELILTIAGIKKQMEMVRIQISNQYEKNIA